MKNTITIKHTGSPSPAAALAGFEHYLQLLSQCMLPIPVSQRHHIMTTIVMGDYEVQHHEHDGSITISY